MNEHVTGDRWPAKDDRNQRLAESADVIRRLLAGHEVDHDGAVRVHRARVWSRPQTPPPLFGAAVSAETAGWLAGRFDGLATVAQARNTLREVVDAYRSAGGEGPCILQVHLSLAESDAAALAIARDQWRHGVIGPPRSWEIEQPEEFDALAGDPDDDALRRAVLIDHDPTALAERIADLVAVGFDRVYVHHVGKEQDDFLEAARVFLVPTLRSST